MEWVIIEGGVAQDSSKEVVVLDLDVLDDSFIDDHTRWEVRDLYERMEPISGIDRYRQMVRDWLDEHDENLCPLCGEPYHETMDGSWNNDGSDACSACYHNARRGGWNGDNLLTGRS